MLWISEPLKHHLAPVESIQDRNIFSLSSDLCLLRFFLTCPVLLSWSTALSMSVCLSTGTEKVGVTREVS